ncbi:MAG: hypothetical protein NTZ52_06550 [Chlamydiae bacterium]|nr:hypothetical protein [Chlamydiota bacterium]
MIGFLLIFLCLLPSHDIAQKIWMKECGGKVIELTHWKKGEEFASVGIGHFIWYPSEKRDRFEETFPELLHFIEERGVSLPAWLKACRICPWNSREEFYQNIEGIEMKSLREFLFATRDLQGEFIVRRLDNAVSRILTQLPESESKRVKEVFDRLSQTPAGAYALVDYLHFKGEGMSSAERYKGQGWGLLQVLLRVSPRSNNLLEDFVRQAKAVLSERVENAPPERHEETWKAGWLNRVDSYLQ